MLTLLAPPAFDIASDVDAVLEPAVSQAVTEIRLGMPNAARLTLDRAQRRANALLAEESPC